MSCVNCTYMCMDKARVCYCDPLDIIPLELFSLSERSMLEKMIITDPREEQDNCPIKRGIIE